MELKEWIDSNGLKIKFFAKKIGVSQSTIFRIFKGELVTHRIREIVRKATRGQVKLPYTLRRIDPEVKRERQNLIEDNLKNE